MKLDTDQIKLLEKIANMGVEFTIFRKFTLSGGYIILSTNELCEFLDNPEEYLFKIGAKEAGVSVADYKNWWSIERKEDGKARCKGIKTNGKQCNMGVDIPLPKDFNPDIDLYCRFHSRLG